MAKGKRPTLKPVVGQVGSSVDAEINNLQGAYQCCETAIEIVGSQQATVKDAQRFENAFGWLQQVRQNILGELHACHQRRQAQQAPPAAAPAPAAVKEEADAPAPTAGN